MYWSMENDSPGWETQCAPVRRHVDEGTHWDLPDRTIDLPYLFWNFHDSLDGAVRQLDVGSQLFGPKPPTLSTPRPGSGSPEESRRTTSRA